MDYLLELQISAYLGKEGRMEGKKRIFLVDIFCNRYLTDSHFLSMRIRTS